MGPSSIAPPSANRTRMSDMVEGRMFTSNGVWRTASSPTAVFMERHTPST